MLLYLSTDVLQLFLPATSVSVVMVLSFQVPRTGLLAFFLVLRGVLQHRGKLGDRIYIFRTLERTFVGYFLFC